jgi:hypothetical protein
MRPRVLRRRQGAVRDRYAVRSQTRLYARETIRIIEGLGLSAADKEKIYRRNAEKLLKIESKVAA